MLKRLAFLYSLPLALSLGTIVELLSADQLKLDR
jgi:hypothetical protein